MPVQANSSRDYKRGAVMGLTVAEAFILLSFVLLLLFAWWQIDTERRSLVSADKIGKMTETQKHEVFSALSDGTFDVAKQLREVGITSLTALSREDAAQFARFIREEDFRQLMNGAIKLEVQLCFYIQLIVVIIQAHIIVQVH